MAEVRNFCKCKVAEFRVNAELLAAQQVVKVNLHKTRVSTLQNLPKILANFFASDHIFCHIPRVWTLAYKRFYSICNVVFLKNVKLDRAEDIQ